MVINLQKVMFKKHFELLIEVCLAPNNNSAEVDRKLHLYCRISNPLSPPVVFPLELHYNLFQNLVQSKIAITVKASNLSVNFSVATESHHSTGIGFRAEAAYSDLYSV